MKFSTRLSLVFIGLSALIAVATTVVSYISVNSEMKTVIKERLEGIAEDLMLRVEVFLFERYTDTKVIASDSILSSRESTPEQIKKRLTEVMNISGYYASLSFFDKNGIRVADTDGLAIGEQYEVDKCFGKMLQGDVCIASEVKVSKTLKIPVIYFGAPVKNGSGTVIGYVISQVPVQKFYDLFSMETSTLPFRQKLEVELIDNSGFLLYSSEDQDGVLNKTLNDWPAVKAIEKDAGSGIFEGFDPKHKVKDLFIYSKEKGYLDFNGNNWILILHIYVADAYKSTTLLRNILTAGAVIIFFAVFLLGIYLTRKISRPVAILKDVSQKIGQGDLDVSSEINAKDEFGDLSNSFIAMAKNLKKSKAALEEYSKMLEANVEARTMELREKVKELEDTKNITLSLLDDTSESKSQLEIALKGLKEKEVQLVQVEKLAGIGQMAAGIAHEINNPLTSILGFAQLMMTDSNINESLKSDLHRIELEAKRCVTIMENLLDFARPQPPQQAIIDINKVVANTVVIVKYSIEREKIKVVQQYNPDIPAIQGDPQQLQQVFMNILINAIHSMPNGGTLTITTSVVESKSKIRVSVADTGFGIPEDVRNKIFEPFFTTSYKMGQKGAGLGLAVCYSIVNAHKGKIEVESEVGKGSVFHIILPVAEEL